MLIVAANNLLYFLSEVNKFRLNKSFLVAQGFFKFLFVHVPLYADGHNSKFLTSLIEAFEHLLGRLIPNHTVRESHLRKLTVAAGLLQQRLIFLPLAFKTLDIFFHRIGILLESLFLPIKKCVCLRLVDVVLELLSRFRRCWQCIAQFVKFIYIVVNKPAAEESSFFVFQVGEKRGKHVYSLLLAILLAVFLVFRQEGLILLQPCLGSLQLFVLFVCFVFLVTAAATIIIVEVCFLCLINKFLQCLIATKDIAYKCTALGKSFHAI